MIFFIIKRFLGKNQASDCTAILIGFYYINRNKIEKFYKNFIKINIFLKKFQKRLDKNCKRLHNRIVNKNSGRK